MSRIFEQIPSENRTRYDQKSGSLSAFAKATADGSESSVEKNESDSNLSAEAIAKADPDTDTDPEKMPQFFMKSNIIGHSQEQHGF